MGKLNIVCGNILNHLNNKDLIVNSANKYMMYSSGVCGATYKKANKELLENYCKQHYIEYMKVNEVRITPGFDLLESYNNIFLSANKKSYKSIVSVSLGTGVHGYKHNGIAKDIFIRLNELVKE